MRRTTPVALVLLWAWCCLSQTASRSASLSPDPPERILNPLGNFEGQTARPLRYSPDGSDFVITNGTEFFNRPIYCVNTSFRVDAGDKPEFSIYLPGRGGNLRFGIKTPADVKWLHDAEQIVARYRPGSMIYEVRDPLLGNSALHLAVLPLNESKGLVARVELSGATEPLELICAFGGVNGMKGRRNGDIGCESEPVSKFFQLRPDQCRDNEFSVETNVFILYSKVATLVGVFPQGARLAVANAENWSSVDDLLASVGQQAALPVVIGRMEIRSGHPLYIVLQQQITPEANVEMFAAAPRSDSFPGIFEAAEHHRRVIAERVVVETPDPFINAAVAALNVAGDGIWDEASGTYMHGAVAWRNRLLGWRGPYVGDALGWHDRARRHFTYWAGQQVTNQIPEGIPPADPTSNLSRNEPALHSNGTMLKSHYDMNLVYIDALFRHFLWTGDLEFARQVWPTIERHLAWERRLFRREFGPDKLPLYEAYAAIWASDDMDYNGGGVTHASAYNHWHNKMAARMAKLLGKDAAPYESEKDLIAEAMRQHLWLPRDGWFAEWKDYLGLQLVHPNPGLWTIYHTIDSGVPTPMEAWQMTRFVDTRIAHIPIQISGGSRREEALSKSEVRSPKSENDQRLLTSSPTGKLSTLPTTSWMPYTWSLNNVVMAEVAHTSLAFWQANRPNDAFSVFKGCVLDSMYLGLCPGNVGMTTYFDMARREAQRDFADAVGVSSRALVEGLFGVQPDAFSGELRVRPGFPADWGHASIKHPDFAASFSRDGLKETFSIEPKFSRPMALRLQIPALRDRIESVTVNSQPVTWQALKDSVGIPRIEIQTAATNRYDVAVVWKGAELSTPADLPIAASGTEYFAAFGAGMVREVADPQGAFTSFTATNNLLRGIASGNLGHRTVFVKLEQGELCWWQPVVFENRPAIEIIPSQNQDAKNLRFRVRNSPPRNVLRHAIVRAGGNKAKIQLQSPGLGESAEIVIPADGLLPGANSVTVELGAPVAGPIRVKAAQGASVPVSTESIIVGSVTNWKIKAGQGSVNFVPVNLAAAFNDKVTHIFSNEYLSPRSPFCSLAIPKQGIGSWCNYQEQFDVDDSGLRAAAAGAGGRFMLPQGVPFQTPTSEEAKNIVFTSQWDNYPREASVPLNGKASHIYLLMAGSSNPMQSRFDNGEIIATYADETIERLALHNPTTWWPIDQDYFIDDYAFRRNEPIPPRVDLKTGIVRMLEVETFKGHGGKVPDGAASVLDMPLNHEKELKSLTVRSLANEVVVGLMAVTLAR